MFNELIFHNVRLIFTEVKNSNEFFYHVKYPTFVTRNQKKDIMFSDWDNVSLLLEHTKVQFPFTWTAQNTELYSLIANLCSATA